MSEFLFTSESVSEGHPDKVADQISNAVLDAILKQDKTSRVAAETLVKDNLVVLAGGKTHRAPGASQRGAGDQGMMFGDACDKTPRLVPIAIYLAHRRVERQAEVRRDGRLAWLRP